MIYDEYDVIEPLRNCNMGDEVAKSTEELLHDMYQRTVSLHRQTMQLCSKLSRYVLELGKSNPIE